MNHKRKTKQNKTDKPFATTLESNIICHVSQHSPSSTCLLLRTWVRGMTWS